MKIYTCIYVHLLVYVCVSVCICVHLPVLVIISLMRSQEFQDNSLGFQKEYSKSLEFGPSLMVN